MSNIKFCPQCGSRHITFFKDGAGTVDGEYVICDMCDSKFVIKECD